MLKKRVKYWNIDKNDKNGAQLYWSKCQINYYMFG